MMPLDELVESTCAAALARAKAGELLGPADMMAIFHLSSSAYYRRKTRGEFNHLMVRGPAVGTHCYSGVLVHRYVSGDAVYEPTFGRKRGVR
jgi:hypothetical protein